MCGAHLHLDALVHGALFAIFKVQVALHLHSSTKVQKLYFEEFGEDFEEDFNGDDLYRMNPNWS